MNKKRGKYDTVTLNCARSSLRRIINLYEIDKINLPFYTCPAVWQSAKKEGCKIKFYHIDENFMPAEEFGADDFIVYTNYFGICAKNVKHLSKKYKNLIIDNAHAFYMPAFGIASFNSVRKFFNVPDGSVLTCDKKISDIPKRNENYERIRFFENGNISALERTFETDTVSEISDYTLNLLQKIDKKREAEKRLQNFYKIHAVLSDTNQIKPDLTKHDIPLIYPYMNVNENLKQKLTKNGIKTDVFWNPLPKETVEGKLQKHLIPLNLTDNSGYETALIILKYQNCMK